AAAVDIPYCHHERWDGTGYPRGLQGEEIPLAARIFAVVDVWFALRSDRPYRPAWTAEDAHVYIMQRAGRDFDPAVVEVFTRLQPPPELYSPAPPVGPLIPRPPASARRRRDRRSQDVDDLVDRLRRRHQGRGQADRVPDRGIRRPDPQARQQAAGAGFLEH